MSEITNLSPRLVWQYFDEITRVPRPSKKEGKIRAFLIDFAKKHHLDYRQDAAGNIVILKPATPGCEKSPVVILQSHMDMVCEKESSSDHDFSADPIPLIRDGRYLTADRTTLGADDGISMAVMMALLSDDSVTASLECLITSEEETGLCGMKAFDFSLLKGRTMINLDSMDEGIATVSCCGGMRSDITVPAGRRPGHLRGYALHLKGFYGGHSGEDINFGRTNAIEAALGLLGTVPGVKIDKIHGGSKDNAIPRECDIYFASDAQNVKELISAENEKLRERGSRRMPSRFGIRRRALRKARFSDRVYPPRSDRNESGHSGACQDLGEHRKNTHIGMRSKHNGVVAFLRRGGA